MNYFLPTTLEVGGVEYKIRTDYRVVLDIFSAMNDPDLEPEEKTLAALIILYEDFDDIPAKDYAEAIKKCLWFINGGKENSPEDKKKPTLINWEKDFPLMVAPINKIVGQDIRGMNMHWWTFLSCYMEIDSKCMFATVVSIRSKLKKGGVGKLDKAEKQFYYENRELIDLPVQLSQEEQDLLNAWGV